MIELEAMAVANRTTQHTVQTGKKAASTLLRPFHYCTGDSLDSKKLNNPLHFPTTAGKS